MAKKSKKIIKKTLLALPSGARGKKRRSLFARRSLGVGGPKVKAKPVKKTKIRVIGIGGGGCSIVSELSTTVKKASFVAANTDTQSLKAVSRKILRFQFGQNLTQGLGTGMDAGLGEMAAQNEKEKIKKLLSGQDLCIIIACLGGGTGSGAAPIFAKIARNLGNISYGIFTLPFEFEGEKKEKVAREALERLKSNLNAISIIPNERIFQFVEKTAPLKIALSAINKNLAKSLEGLIETIYEPGLINIDFADLRTIFEGKGRLTYLNSVEVSGLEKEEDLIKKALHSPLYPYTIRGAKGILFNVIGEKNLELSEVSKISKAISDSVNREAKIIFGISQKKFPGRKQKERKVKITILATGCGKRIFPDELKKVQKKVVLKESKPEKKEKKVVKKLIPAKEKKKIKTKIKTDERERKKRKVKSQPALPKKITTLPPPSRAVAKGEKEDLSSLTSRAERGGRRNEVSLTSRAERGGNESFSSSTFRKRAPEGEEKNILKPPVQDKIEVKIRRNALEIKKDVEAVEKELIAEENKWETPAFLRRKLLKKNYEPSD